jgi:hypothetical protein
LIRGGLGPENLRSIMFYRGHRDMMEKASHHFKKNLYSIKNVFESLAILKKASISLKKSSIIIEIFIKAQHF